MKALSVKLAEPKKPAPRRTQAPGAGRATLANELLGQQNNELTKTKEELEAAYEKIRNYEEMDAVQEVNSLKGRLKELDEVNRGLKLEMEQVRYSTGEDQAEKLKELTEKIAFFQGQKDAGEKEKGELKKKIERLEAELEEGAEKEEMLLNLTMKVESLEEKNQQLKSDLEKANLTAKNAEMLGGGKGNEELQESITTLNEMVTMLESELKEEQEKTARLEAEVENSAARLNDLVKLERRLKSKDD